MEEDDAWAEHKRELKLQEKLKKKTEKTGKQEEIGINGQKWKETGKSGENREKREKQRKCQSTIKQTEIIKKIRENEPNAKIIIMGDLNDDPINTSLKEVLKTKADKEDVLDVYHDAIIAFIENAKKGKIDSIQVIWPSGKISNLFKPDVNTILSISES